MKHTVNPEANPEVSLTRLDVNVGGPLVDRPRDNRVDEFDDRRFVDRGLESSKILDLSFVVEQVTEVGDRIIESGHAGYGVFDFGFRGNPGKDIETSYRPDVINRQHVGRVGHRHN